MDESAQYTEALLQISQALTKLKNMPDALRTVTDLVAERLAWDPETINQEIDERVRAAREMHDVLLDMEGAEEQAGLGSWHFDVHTGKGWWSKQMYRLLGHDPARGFPSNEEYLDLIHPEDRASVRHALEQMALGNLPEKRDFRTNSERSEPRILSPQYRVERNQAGDVVKFFGTVLDMTRRKQIEQEILYRQTLLERVLVLGKRIAAITDLQVCLREIHRSIRQDLGFDRVGLFLYDSATQNIHGAYGTSRTGEIEDTSWYVVSSRSRPAWQVAIHSPTGMTLIDDYQAAHNPPPGSEMVGVKQYVTLAAWAGDKPVAVIAADNLITQRVMNPADLEALHLFSGYAGLAIENARLNAGLEQRVKERTAEVQDLYDNAPTGYHSLDDDGTFIMINQTELKWLGYTKGEIVGVKKFPDLLTPQTLPVFVENFPRFMAQGWIKDLEFEFICKDGSILPVLLNATAIYDADGKYLYSRSTVLDITERKKADEALRQSRDELGLANATLEKAALLKNEFLANMSHELRTPLNSILAFSESLLEQVRGPLNERQQASIRNIETSGRHLLALINDILDLSKVEAGRLDLQLDAVAVTDVCQASLVFIKEVASKKQLVVAYQLNDQLALMEADAKRLKQMLVNLLSNAVKFTPTGGKVSLEVTADKTAGVIRFVVQDTGIGIAPEDMARLFQPFTQLDSSLSRQHEGTGLGLSLVLRLAELHGGGVEVESEVGKGSRFTIVLPYRRPTSAHSVVAPMPARASAIGTLCAALVVEDMNSAAEQLVRYLEEFGIHAVVHAQGTGALTQAISLQPNVILLDLLMPDQTGWAVLAQLKADPRTRGIPVIIVSVVDERMQGLAAGAAEYLVKPVSREMLWQALHAVAAVSGADREALVFAPQRDVAAGARILLVEDNETSIRAIGEYLQDKGYQVATAHNGREALDAVSAGRPALILMDIQMPEMDGLETTRRLRARPESSATPIIVLTALAMPGDRERCLVAGASEYMTKPVSLHGLVATIQRLL